MKLVVQRVTNASVKVDNSTVGEIDEGLMALVGFGQNDTTREADFLARKLIQFTLYGKVKKNRPSFHKALNPDDASNLFDYFVEKCGEEIPVETGEFGAYMEVSLLNNGPVTILLEKDFSEDD